MGWLNDLFTGAANFIKVFTGPKAKVDPLEPMTDENMGWTDAGKLTLDEEPTVTEFQIQRKGKPD